MVHEVVTPSLSHVLTAFSECLRAYFPKLHLFFSNLLQKIFLDNPEIKLMFEGCCYGACHFNLHTASSKDHEDFLNVLFAMCAVYSSGSFAAGISLLGHLVLSRNFLPAHLHTSPLHFLLMATPL